jgi:hydroxymethylpyrimidine pyrophosphatase-like HAD family hydrolase
MKTIAIDFDATIATYDGFKGKGVFGNPVEGASRVIKQLKQKGWKIIIYTTRSETHQIIDYLDEHNIPYDYINHNPKNIELGCSLGKPLADVYLDDRAITFDGNWGKALYDVENFSEWWKNE